MMISRPFLNRQFLEEEEEECRDDADFESDDSDGDPSYYAVEEKFDQFSRTVEQTEPELDETDSNDTVLHFSKLDIMDDSCLEKIKMIVEAGQIEKLKVDHCKMYLRKNGLRLSGNKDTLVKRIKEHLEILNAGGEKKYPVSSFVLNCTGDACTGDVVMFEQNVYEMFSIASRSATGPPCGTRTIVGRIVKEGYGAAKQQHTFTVEVLWSKGTKPLPPLYPLLIKGRNLYRMKTLRQRWENEGDRQRVLLEKHSRGSLARSARATRVLEKEKRKMLKKNRKEGSNGSSTTQAQKTAFIVSESSRKSADPQRSSLSTDSKKVPLEIIHGHNRKENQNQTRASQNMADNIKKNGGEHFQKVPTQRNIIDFPPQLSRPLKGMNLQSTGQAILQDHMQQQYCRYHFQTVPSQRNIIDFLPQLNRPLKGMNLQPTGQAIPQGHMQQQEYCRHHFQKVPSQRNIIDFPPQLNRPLKGMNLQPTGQAILLGHMQQQEYCRHHFQKFPSQRNIIDVPPQLSRPLKGMNLQSTGRPILQGHMQQQQYCPYQGRYYYGENCKFSHDIREKCVTEMRVPDVLRSLVMREYR